MSDTDHDPQEQRSPSTYYVYKPNLVGAPMEFLLQPDNLEWRGRFSGRIFFRDIRKIRLSFRPVTTENYRFMTEIWAKPGKISFASTSWTGVVRQERHNAEYTAFTGELHRRVAATGGNVEYRCGSPSLLYWPGVVVFAGLCLGMVMLAFQGVQSDSKLGALVVGAMMLYFLWMTASFFWHNLPGRYAPDAPPRRVLP